MTGVPSSIKSTPILQCRKWEGPVQRTSLQGPLCLASLAMNGSLDDKAGWESDFYSLVSMVGDQTGGGQLYK